MLLRMVRPSGKTHPVQLDAGARSAYAASCATPSSYMASPFTTGRSIFEKFLQSRGDNPLPPRTPPRQFSAEGMVSVPHRRPQNSHFFKR